VAEQVEDRVADHALGGLDPAEHQHRGIRHGLPGGQTGAAGLTGHRPGQQ
jgi:hypothetical protein